MPYETWPADFDQWFRCLQALIRLEIHAELDRRSAEPVRLVMPTYPNGAPPLYHLSDDDIAWQIEQVQTGRVSQN